MQRGRFDVSAIMNPAKGRLKMKFTVEYEQEEDGRWLAEVKELPGVLAYGKDPDDAAGRAQALALRVVADRLENGESTPFLMFTFETA
jgi:predicted RNase H-like HicB family nuclease